MPLTAGPLVDTLREDMPQILNPQKRSARRGPLHQVKCGSVSVPIYRCASGSQIRYFICYYQGGRRIRRAFSRLDDAKREALLAGRQIAAGLEKATGLTLSEREAHDAAKKLLASTGIPLLSAVEEYVRSRELLGGHTLELRASQTDDTQIPEKKTPSPNPRRTFLGNRSLHARCQNHSGKTLQRPRNPPRRHRTRPTGNPHRNRKRTIHTLFGPIKLRRNYLHHATSRPVEFHLS